MRHFLRRVYNTFAMSGIDPLTFLRSLKGIPFYLYDLKKIKKQQKASSVVFPLKGMWPCLGDKFVEGGSASGHYFHQDLLVARKIFNANPSVHIDVGSRIDGFVAHVASFREIKVFDIRPVMDCGHSNIRFVQCDMMGELDESLFACCDSLSCLHALEHFGLGRYGDPVRFDGYLDGFDNLLKILKKDGVLYLSVPIGEQRIEFNAHRVFSIEYLLSLFVDCFDVIGFSYIDDNGSLHENVDCHDGVVDNFECQYGCGVFELKKNR